MYPTQSRIHVICIPPAPEPSITNAQTEESDVYKAGVAEAQSFMNELANDIKDWESENNKHYESIEEYLYT